MKYTLMLCTALCGIGTGYFIRLAWHDGDIIATILFAGILAVATLASGLWTWIYFKRF